MKDKDTYICECCGGVFEKERTDEEANAEAEDVFGVKNASEQEDMAIICDDCYKKMQNHFGWKDTPDES